MIRKRAFRVGLALALGAMLAASAPSLPHAADAGASTWASGFHASFRLVDGGAAEAPGLRKAGIEIRLDPHFKTYWRTPGDSGLPPSFDWSGSDNVKAVEVRWPLPARFEDAAGSSIGYKESVLLPLRVTLANPARPAALNLKLDYAVCEQICIPVKGEARLPLGSGAAAPPFAPAVAAAEARAPVRKPAGSGAPPSIEAAAAAADGGSIAVSAVIPPGADPVELFAEAGQDWLFGAPALVKDEPSRDARRVTWRLAVDAAPTDARLAGLPVTITLSVGGTAIEVETRLDAEPKPH
ncbi:protein-disulfide reductase DsbD domain-containing protein [Alsobacter sp. KACC 23698]|uniref:Protein-disulfide reductase DsbD domain-containing protein n=1 Tax=Alsobacter sp. KACC 23698 TaxID=3149229 RepID=A0AAU7JHX0_9HYPH